MAIEVASIKTLVNNILNLVSSVVKKSAGALLASLLLCACPVWGVVAKKSAPQKAAAKRSTVKAAAPSAKAKLVLVKASAKPARARLRGGTGPWRVPTYANSVEGDQFDGDDAVVREAAVSALRGLNGTVVVGEAETGRVLTIVNQKLAFRDGFEPCSTVKIPVALAALSESIVERDTPLRLNRFNSIDMTDALAKSNKQYFATLGEKLGFERMSAYARQFGLGEKAGLNIAEERVGLLPASAPKSGMGMMTSFGEGIRLTPLQLTALVGAIANGGTLFYLQYPRTLEEGLAFLPQVKRKLEIDALIPEIMPGLKGAVDYGTARRIAADLGEGIYGKTGTCTDERSPTHLGWFGSFMETPRGRLVVTTLLTGGRPVSGPVAAGVAGQVYRNLEAAGYFGEAASR